MTLLDHVINDPELNALYNDAVWHPEKESDLFHAIMEQSDTLTVEQDELDEVFESVVNDRDSLE